MQRFLPGLFLSVGLLASFGCRESPQVQFQEIEHRDDLSVAEKADAKAGLIAIGPRPPQALTESEWMAIPLGYALPETKKRISIPDVSGSSSYKNALEQSLYNVLFYHPISGEHHLLVDTCCLALQSFMADSSLIHHLAGTHILYSIQEPQKGLKLPIRVLYASDRTGQRLVRISPPGYHVTSWHPVPGVRQLLLELGQDTNGDSLLTQTDVPTVAVADISEAYPNLITLLPRTQLDSLRRQLLRLLEDPDRE